jgi:TolB-like protein/tetratricopeptide (TPR) repeat protein
MRIAAMVTVVLGISVAALLLARRHSADAEQVPNAAAPDPSRIAVLYPDAPASDTQLVTISRGLARDLIYELERVPGLTLVSTAALGQSTSSIAVDSVIQALRVGTVVTGALERTGGAIRVDMRLVDAGTRAERPVVRVAYAPAMLLDLRDTVVGEVARQLRPEIGRAVRAFEWRARTASTTAWVQRQQAQELIERERAVARVAGNAADPLALLTRADSLLARAVREDPLWAEPLIERGWLRVRRLRYRDRRGYAAEIDSGLAFAALALARDATDARARALRGALRFRRWSDVPGAAPGLLDSAASDLRAATTADPHLARAWNSLSGVLRQQGDMAGAVDAVRQAAGADAYLDEVPESVTRLVFAYLYANRPDSAALVCREWRQRIPRESSLHACELVVLGWSARSMADADRAWVITRDIEGTGVWPLVRGMSPAARYYVAAILARAGRGDSAKSVMRTTRQRLRAAGEPDAALMNEAYALVLLDARDSAVATLQHAVRADTADRARIARSPWFAPLHGDRRYRELVRAP